jgi:hypothetical protein
MNASKTISPEALAALKDYAVLRGRNWKSAMRNDWIYGGPWCNPELARLRNTHGPSWLKSFKLSWD